MRHFSKRLHLWSDLGDIRASRDALQAILDAPPDNLHPFELTDIAAYIAEHDLWLDMRNNLQVDADGIVHWTEPSDENPPTE